MFSGKGGVGILPAHVFIDSENVTLNESKYIPKTFNSLHFPGEMWAGVIQRHG